MLVSQEEDKENKDDIIYCQDHECKCCNELREAIKAMNQAYREKQGKIG